MRVALGIGLAAPLAGCAGGALVPSRSVAGQSGSIAWEVRDVARNAAQGGWDYDVVLTEQAGVPVRFPAPGGRGLRRRFGDQAAGRDAVLPQPRPP
jgi:hypothetical protein